MKGQKFLTRQQKSQKRIRKGRNRCPVRGTLVVPLEGRQRASERTMQAAFEFLTSAVFFLFIAVQVGLVSMIVLARLLKVTGAIKEGHEHRGIKGFLQGFC
jgi:hypothetical protein